MTLTLSIVAFAASTALAVIVQLPNGQFKSYQSLRSAPPGGAEVFDAFFHNLDYNGGPVMPSNTNYTVYWSPGGPGEYPAEYQEGVDRYLTDLAHDSGLNTNVDSVATQYNDATGDFANYRSTFGGRLEDTHGYPAEVCGTTGEATHCLTDEQIQTELSRYINEHGLPRDGTHEYFLLLPPKVATCMTVGGACSVGGEKVEYCAYHGNSGAIGSGGFIYSNDPYVTGFSGCDDGNHPNGVSDGALEGGLSHEHNESITDPEPNNTWTDWATGSATGFENGDKCRNVGITSEFGTQLGEFNGAKYNQLVNGDHYWYQQEWSNQSHECMQRLTFNGTQPTATFTSLPDAGNEMTFNAAGSTAPGGVFRYSWRFNDGSTPVETTGPTVSHIFPTAGAYTVALTVFAEGGTSIGSAGIISTGDEGPEAAMSVTTATPAAGQPVSFNGSGSTDSDGSITGYEWNFGDGSAAGMGTAPSHIYAAVGTYTATLRVEDSSGQIATISHPVVVDEAPTASFSVAPVFSTAGQPVSFDGSASSDPDGSIASYSWNFGDGSASGSGATASHIYSTAGTYTVTLTVIDSAGATSAASHQATAVAVPSGPTTTATATTTAATTTAAATTLPVTPNSNFTSTSAAFNQTTGAITFTESVAQPGTFRSLVTFPNGMFGALVSANAKCKAGFVRLSGKCRPAKIVFAKGSKTVTAAAAVTFTLKPSASALKALKNALKQRKGLPVTATITFQSSLGGSPVSRRQSLVVKLKKK